ncbi:MAG TPA: 23S rRNA (uracil(1939)-C(5))-methyltransferase RlmD [Methylococcaceae bacterium]|nr:23S rRNA (uracil(1939)-C(5))-methyltransferase RlmD [Methylococcaceae bacterium]
MARMSRRARLPTEAAQAAIDSLTHDGRGVAHVDGRAVFIDGALPGETVRFRYTGIRRDFAEGRAETVLESSPERVEPFCAHFGVCGGCALQHLAPEAQIRYKQTQLLEQLKRIGKTEPASVWAPLTGPVAGYRHKARLGVKFVAKKGRVLVGFREKSSALLADLQRCPVLHPAVGEKLEALGGLIFSLGLRDKIPQIEVALGDDRHALVFRVMDDPGVDDLARLAAFGAAHGFDIYLQRHGPDSLRPLYLDQSAGSGLAREVPEGGRAGIARHEYPPLPGYALEDFGVDFRFRPGEFTQVNPAINRHMVARAVELLDLRPEDTVLDLFCGLGNFTLPLARRAGEATGVEGDAGQVERARDNARRNGLENVYFHAADLFQPVKGQDWAERRYDKLLLDPSRAGAREILEYIPRWKPARIVYVSCNPATLARDAGVLVHDLGYRLLGAGVMDMFPHTAHVESIALFGRGK